MHLLRVLSVLLTLSTIAFAITKEECEALQGNHCVAAKRCGIVIPEPTGTYLEADKLCKSLGARLPDPKYENLPAHKACFPKAPKNPITAWLNNDESGNCISATYTGNEEFIFDFKCDQMQLTYVLCLFEF